MWTIRISNLNRWKIFNSTEKNTKIITTHVLKVPAFINSVIKTKPLRFAQEKKS